MKSIEVTAKTVEEAIAQGLTELGGLTIADVDVYTLEEGSKGLFGLFGSRPAKVRLTVKEQEEDLLDLLAPAAKKSAPKAEKPIAKPAPKVEKPIAKPAPKVEKPIEKPAATKAEKPVEKPAAKAEKPVEQPAAPKAEKPAVVSAEEKVSEKPVSDEKAPKARKPRNHKPKEKEDGNREPREKKPLPPKAPVKPMEKPVVTMIPNEEVAADTAAGKAQAFLKELTTLMGVNVDVAVGTDTEGNVFASMTGDTLGILIGRRGETLDALQYLTSLKVNRGEENYTRVTIDTENYRAKREDTLIRLANRMANRAIKTGRKVSLEPMNPYERRIIHSALQPNEAVDTHSEGEEPNRHIVITLRK